MLPLGSRAITLLLLSSTLGCGAFGRARECQGVIEAVNGGLSQLGVQVPDAGASASAYASIANGYAALAQRLEALAPADPALAKALVSYRELTERAAQHSRAYSKALSAPAKTARQRGQRQADLDRIRGEAQADVAREALVVRKINAVCHPQ